MLGNRRKMYIGQTHNIQNRLKQHLRKKEFWECAYAFSTITEQFNTTETQFLEHIAIKTAIESEISNLLENCQIPAEPFLSPSDKEHMLTVFNTILVLLEFTGIKMFSKNSLSVDMSEIQHENSHNIMSRIVKEYSKKYTPIEEESDCYESAAEETEIVSYTIRGTDFFAEAIPLNNSSLMIYPNGFISKSVDLQSLSDYVDVSNAIDSKDRHIKKDIIIGNLETGAFIISGKKDAALWKKNIQYI